ncbi:hypothetical protein BD309DRAFT_852859, partial [Dichomitus squalens]
LWVIGYQGPMGYGVEFPLSRLGKAKILWVSGVYGLPGVWVRRVSTVPSSSSTISFTKRGTVRDDRRLYVCLERDVVLILYTIIVLSAFRGTDLT